MKLNLGQLTRTYVGTFLGPCSSSKDKFSHAFLIEISSIPTDCLLLTFQSVLFFLLQVLLLRNIDCIYK